MTDPTFRIDPASRTALIILAAVAGFAALKLAEDIFAPLCLALVAGIILSPLADSLERRLKLPRTPVAAALPMLGILAVGALAFALEPLVGRLVDQWPTIRWELRGVVNDFRGFVQNLGQVGDEVQRALGGSGADETAAPSIPTLTDALFVAPRIGAQILIFIAALFFFLLTRSEVYAWIASFAGRRLGREAILTRIRTAERLVAVYFLTITLINVGLGVSLAVALGVLGMPGAIAWGAGAALLNFVLYVGPATMVAALLLGGLIVFDGWASVLPAAIYLVLNGIESQVATPTFVGRRIAVNPLAIFVSLVFWLWFWGPLGGVIAIPVLVIVLAMLDIFDEPEPDMMPEPEPSETL
ncbi:MULTISPECIES: AI-2E family transporter [Rhodovulum]|uniref:PurR-regulated permease PerM n=2 Tax=Rhodovulum TaxID=34008 RepID=A0ABX9DIF8_9RHOB|nr:MULTISPECIES: AI-2E family transporter [Rhodovulum]PTW49655.1 putative PurR-regulated permease PerM [Rhodovulum kholense]RAP41181.1 hypothetical protein BYZ73_10890 [Rhodovulum viride]